MNLVDSCGWLEYLADGPNAVFFASAIENTDDLRVPTLCILEVFKGLTAKGRGCRIACSRFDAVGTGYRP